MNVIKNGTKVRRYVPISLSVSSIIMISNVVIQQFEMVDPMSNKVQI